MQSVQTKLRYGAPSIVTVGGIDALTNGHSTPVGDPPHDGTTGYYDSSKMGNGEEVSLDDR